MQKTRNAKRTIHNSVDDIKDHAYGMTDSVREIGDAVKNVLIEKFTEMLKRAVSLGDRGTEAAKGAAQDLRENIEERIVEKPYKAVLIAAGVGVLIGLVLRRR
jgi:ElaB/YqjD/DUF883 family membrane-anchored ribosome-binding protein